MDLLTVAILAGTKMAREAMSDVLKLTFNLLLHYPKVHFHQRVTLDANILSQMVETEPQTPEATNDDEPKVLGDFWSSNLDGYGVILVPISPAI